jgi:hypothetical protein
VGKHWPIAKAENKSKLRIVVCIIEGEFHVASRILGALDSGFAHSCQTFAPWCIRCDW